MAGLDRVRRNRTRRRAVLVIAALATAVGAIGPVPDAEAAGVRYLDEVFDDYTVTDEGLVYGQSVNYQNVLQQHELDVLQPVDDPAPTGRAAVVWVHGGFFKRGSKDVEWYEEARAQFAKAGYVVFSINYRLNESLPEGLLPTIETLRLEEYIQEAKDSAHDAQAAVRWVRQNAATYGVNPDKIAIAGHSAGGIISQMVAWNDEEPGNVEDPNDDSTLGVSSRVAAAVSSAGGSLPVVLSQVSLGEPPVLLSHGVADDVVPYPADLPSCVLTVVLGNVCEQQLDPDQAHGQFGYDGWREFLYRRMINPPALDLPVQVRLVGLESLFGG